MKSQTPKKLICVALFALAFQLPAHGTDTDGFSDLKGAFLSLPPSLTEMNENVVEYHSFDITNSARSGFSERCAQKKYLWVDNTNIECLSFRLNAEDASLYVETPAETWHEEKLYRVVATHPTPAFRTRELSLTEQSLVKAKLTVKVRKQAAIGLGNKSIVLVGYKKDSNDNLLTRAFLISGNSISTLGDLQNWPDELYDLDGDGVPEAIINVYLDAFTIEAYTFIPSIKIVASVSEGG